MIGVDAGHRYCFYRPPTDVRKSFDGLCGLVGNEMKRDPLSGDVFVFVNRRRNLVKLLFYERTCFWLFYTSVLYNQFEESHRI